MSALDILYANKKVGALRLEQLRDAARNKKYYYELNNYYKNDFPELEII